MWRLVVCLAVALSSDAMSAGQDSLKLTYVGNTGFLIEAEGHKVAVDALFGGWTSEDYDVPSDSVVALMKAAQPPFANIDVIAITHWHVDHFDAGIVIEHLKHSPQSNVICPSQVGDRLASQPGYSEVKGRIHSLDIPVDSVTSYSLFGISVRVLSSHHGAYFDVDSSGKTVDIHRETQNLEYLFAVGSHTVFHCGDAALTEKFRYRLLGLGRDSIDVAFVQKWGCHDLPLFQELIIRDEILPRRIFFTHMRPRQGAVWAASKECRSHRGVTIAEYPLQTWSIPRAVQ